MIRQRLIFFRVNSLSLRMTLDPEIAIETLISNDGVCHYRPLCILSIGMTAAYNVNL